VEGNDLPRRWAALAPSQRFVVGEVGFGTGLNFLCAWQQFEASAPADARLCFVSCELDPLSPPELHRALAIWPQLAVYRDALLAQYAALAPGWHRFHFGRVQLTLVIGDARQTLPRLAATVDAWFFDGFSPAKNPQLWEAELFAAAAQHSAPGATLATYSVAGTVRRAAAAAGFTVWKSAGFGSKREMLRGKLDVSKSSRSPARHGAVRTATVIGAGLAGCAAAASLGRRGWSVRLIERRSALASEASGNAQAVLYARLSSNQTPLSTLVLAGYQYTLRVLPRLLSCDAVQWSDCPVLQLAIDARKAKRHHALAALGVPEGLLRQVDATEVSDVARVALAHGGLLFPAGGWVNPPALCAALAGLPGVEVMTSTAVDDLVWEAGRWRVRAGSRCAAESEIVVLAVAGAATTFEAAAHLPLRSNRGQITLLPATADSANLGAVVCADGYITPARQGWHTAGSTFARESGTDVRPADNAANVAMLRSFAPALYAALGLERADPKSLDGRAGLRCVSPDYLPLVGPLFAASASKEPNLYVSLAHGSRGLITAPLAGEILAACIEDEPAPLPAELMAALAPARFARGE